jgi:DNA invertase Pin-like site-specific DNA recombinase
MGWNVVAVYENAGISGANGRDKRPGFDRMLKDAVRRKFDVLMAWSVDRLGRSLLDLISALPELHGAGADQFLHQQAVDTTTAAGKAMYQMLGVFAEFERAVIQARVNAGIARARVSGTRSGKPIGRPTISPEQEAAIRNHLNPCVALGRNSSRPQTSARRVFTSCLHRVTKFYTYPEATPIVTVCLSSLMLTPPSELQPPALAGRNGAPD